MKKQEDKNFKRELKEAKQWIGIGAVGFLISSYFFNIYLQSHATNLVEWIVQEIDNNRLGPRTFTNVSFSPLLIALSLIGLTYGLIKYISLKQKYYE